MRKLWYGSALLGVAITSSGVTAAVLPRTKIVVAAPAAKAAVPAPRPAVKFSLPLKVTGTVVVAPVKAKKAAPKKATHPVAPPARHITHGPTVTPSLYEATTSIKVLRAQGCRAGRARTNGLVVLDFGKLAYRTKFGYGTITFADRFASNRTLTWAAKSFAHGYSVCLPKGATAHIKLALGTSNYGIDVPSPTEAGVQWAKATAAIGEDVKRHHFTHVTAAAGDDVEPAWDRGFKRTYEFFKGYGSAHTGYLIYNYGSLDGGVVDGIWKLRQAYYVAGGMYAARAVPEIYNREMAEQWAELARKAVDRYGKPIKLAGLMTQHTKHCRRCGYTAAEAHKALVHELAKHPKTAVRNLASATNIGSPAPVSAGDVARRG